MQPTHLVQWPDAVRQYGPAFRRVIANCFVGRRTTHLTLTAIKYRLAANSVHCGFEPFDFREVFVSHILANERARKSVTGHLPQFMV